MENKARGRFGSGEESQRKIWKWRTETEKDLKGDLEVEKKARGRFGNGEQRQRKIWKWRRKPEGDLEMEKKARGSFVNGEKKARRGRFVSEKASRRFVS
jgi:predicted transcriptional regulator